VPARQFEQWQLMAYRNASSTSYRTARHSHRPLSIRPLAIFSLI
jgi:hypothetical protein